MPSFADLLKTLDKPHLRYADISPLIDKLKQQNTLKVKQVGYSFESRPIHLISLGQGPIVIFAWSQMHGDETTATAALFDLLGLFINNDSNGQPAKWQKKWRNEWQHHFTIHLLPMLNPDGAQRCTRQNAQGIDINRDALALQSPEGRILIALVEQLKPAIGLNLHDQSDYYRAGNAPYPATISFLAPAFDYAESINSSRKLAMQIIAHMRATLESHVPHCIARYHDGYSPRCFGDTIAAKKVSTILIESGAARNDKNRQVARKMNVLAFVELIQFLNQHFAGKQNLREAHSQPFAQVPTVEDYFAIPCNQADMLTHLVIHQLSFKAKDSIYKADICVTQTSRNSGNFIIDFIGDLGTGETRKTGMVECYANSKNLMFLQGTVYHVNKQLTLTNQAYLALLKTGALVFHDPNNLLVNESDYDVYINDMALGQVAAFELYQPAYCLFTSSTAQGDKTDIIGAMLNGTLIWF